MSDDTVEDNISTKTFEDSQASEQSLGNENVDNSVGNSDVAQQFINSWSDMWGQLMKTAQNQSGTTVKFETYGNLNDYQTKLVSTDDKWAKIEKKIKKIKKEKNKQKPKESEEDKEETDDGETNLSVNI